MKKFLKDYAFYIVIGLLICLRLANVFVINVVSGESMLPNYKNGELLVGTGIKGELQRGDIVVAKPGTGNKLVIKRIIGLPGEHIVLEMVIFMLMARKLKLILVKKIQTLFLQLLIYCHI